VKTFREAIVDIDRGGAWSVAQFLEEIILADFEDQMRDRIEELRRNPVFEMKHNVDFDLARLCYAICRATKPEIVVETGVAHGVTTSFILRALSENEYGRLISIDLPPLSGRNKDKIGVLVPSSLRDRWELLYGSSRSVLPRLVNELCHVDLFVHDSLHTYRNITFELNAIDSLLSNKAIVIADDIERNTAFYNWAGARQPYYWSAVQEKKEGRLFGVSVIGHENSISTQ